MSPVSGSITPFLARKGDGGMVGTAVGYRRHSSRTDILRQSPAAAGDAPLPRRRRWERDRRVGCLLAGREVVLPLLG